MSDKKRVQFPATLANQSGLSSSRVKNNSEGFTQVEIIVALTVLSLILLATLTAVHSLGSSQARLDHTIRRLEEMRLVSQFLRATVRQSVPVNSAGTYSVYFYGETDELRWAAPLQGVEGAAGLQYLRLYHHKGVLNVQFIPYHPANSDPQWSETKTYPLLDSVDEITLAYRRGINQPWLDTWNEEPTGLPQAVSIRVKSRQRYWPDLMVVPDQYRHVP